MRITSSRISAAVPLLLLSLAVVSSGQQSYVSRFDAYVGYTYLNSSHIGLVENGFQTQAGVRVKTWLSFGFDYSRSTGTFTLTPNLLTTSLQQTLGAQIAQLIAAGVIPPTYQLLVPVGSVTQTFAAGPQISYRHFKYVTLFVRPSCGIIHEVGTPHPSDPVATAIVKQLAPSGTKSDNVFFYGFGGGFDYLFTKHFALRAQADFVHDHLFDGLLKDGRNTVRFSVGPAINFGPNIVR